MLRANGICVAGRLGSVNRSSSVRLPRYLGVPLQSRSLSLASLERGRSIPLRLDQRAVPGLSRNFWWSSKPAETPATTTATPVDVSPQAPAETAPAPEEVATTSSAAPVDPVSVPDVAAVPDATSAAEVAVSALPDPTLLVPLQYGDFAALGIASWSPPGLCAWGIELLQVSTSMPWFWTIIAAGLLSRVILFPISVMTMKQSVALIPHQPEINVLREEMAQAQRSKDPLQMQKAILKQRVLYEKIGVSLPMMMAAPFLQLPVTLGMFFGVKRICDLPVEQLKWSGLDILPNLTVPDPFYVLPLIATAAMNVQLSVGMKDMSAAPQMPHLINLFRALSMLGVVFMANLPSGVVVYITTSIFAMTGQTLLLRIPAVRRALGIPILPGGVGNKPASMYESIQYAQKWFKEKMDEAKEDALKAQRRAGRR